MCLWSLSGEGLVDGAVDGGLCAVGGRLEEEGVDDVDLDVLERADHVLDVPAKDIRVMCLFGTKSLIMTYYNAQVFGIQAEQSAKSTLLWQWQWICKLNLDNGCVCKIQHNTSSYPPCKKYLERVNLMIT